MESFVNMFNQFKIIHCMCPKCDALMRISDLQLRSKEKTESTWLDMFDSKEKNVIEKEEKFADEKKEIQQKAALRGREKVPELVNKSINKKFADLNYDPYDVKAILHPIDFVVFNGMNKGQVTDVTLLSGKTENPHMQNFHSAIADAVREKRYDWKVLRVSHDGEVEYK